MARCARQFYSSIVAVLLCAGCGDASAPLREPGAANEQVWITTERDSLDLVEHVLGTQPPTLAVAGAERGALVALRVPRSALAAISQSEHELRHRCGGFVLHNSEGDARSALGAGLQGASLNKNAPSYTVDNPVTVGALLSALSEQNVLATVRQLSSYHSRFHTSAASMEAVNWLHATWSELARSRPDISVELVPHLSTPQPSVKMTMHGASQGDELVVLGGHIDSIGGSAAGLDGPDRLARLEMLSAPGADDNAASIAVLTEVLRAAVELDYRPARSVVFYAYAAEEVGLIGSGEIAARAKEEELNVVGVMQLDMINFTAAPEPYITFVRDETDAALNAFSIALIDTYIHLPYRYRQCGYACSDHASWTRHGFPSTFPNEAAGSDRNPSAHTAEDTLALTNDSVVHSMHFARLGAAFLAELAKGQLGQPVGACHESAECGAGESCDQGHCTPPLRANEPLDEPAEREKGCSLSTLPSSNSASATLLAALLLAQRRRSRKPAPARHVSLFGLLLARVSETLRTAAERAARRAR